MYSIDKLPSVIDIGRVGEKNFRFHEFDMTAWMEEMPDGIPSIVVIRPGDSSDDAYIAATTFENNILTWTVTESDTAHEGTGSIQIWLEREDEETSLIDKRGKSAIVAIRVNESINDPSSEVPAPQTACLEQMTALKVATVDAKSAAEAAQTAAENAQAATEGFIDDAEAWAVGQRNGTDVGETDPTYHNNSKYYSEQSATSAGDADTAKQAAEAAQGAAETAQGAAETAQGKAETAQGKAEDAQEAAESAASSAATAGATAGEAAAQAVVATKADKVSNATSGNFAGLDSNGNLTDSGHKHSDYLTQHQDITGKVDKNQGSGNAGKVLGIGNDGYVAPVEFQGSDFVGATSSANGVHGYVPAPLAGDQQKYLRADGTWDNPPGSKPIPIALDTVTNVSGSYTHTTASQYATASMKPIQIECSNPDAFQDAIIVTVTDGYITLECDEVSGTSDVTVTVMKALNPSEGDPPAVTSTEFDILNNRIGNLSSLTTTDKTSSVAAINELNSKIGTVPSGQTVEGQITSLNSKITSKGFVRISGTLAKESSKTFVVPNAYRGILSVHNALYSDINAFLLITCSGGGDVLVAEIYKGSYISISTGTNTLTITNGAPNSAAILYKYDFEDGVNLT